MNKTQNSWSINPTYFFYLLIQRRPMRQWDGSPCCDRFGAPAALKNLHRKRKKSYGWFSNVVRSRLVKFQLTANYGSRSFHARSQNYIHHLWLRLTLTHASHTHITLAKLLVARHRTQENTLVLVRDKVHRKIYERTSQARSQTYILRRGNA